MGEGGHINCNASLSQPNVQKTAEPMLGKGGGLKFEKRNAEKNQAHT